SSFVAARARTATVTPRRLVADEAGVKRKPLPPIPALLKAAASRGFAAAGVNEPRLPGAGSEIADARCFAGFVGAAMDGPRARAPAAIATPAHPAALRLITMECILSLRVCAYMNKGPGSTVRRRIRTPCCTNSTILLPLPATAGRDDGATQSPARRKAA